MRIQNNLAALNTYRQMGQNDIKQAKTTEKLSSGYKINRAADDAAGLSISEKMRAQIRGLNRASTNAQDGISMIQAAEGALQETQSMLQRMRELAVQGANDVNSVDDRMSIKMEIDQLGRELDRIATTTSFNGKYILSGQYQNKDAWNNIPDDLKEIQNIEAPTGMLNFQVGANTLDSDVIRIRIPGVTASDILNDRTQWSLCWVDDEGFMPGGSPNEFSKKFYETGTNIANHEGFGTLIDKIDGFGSCLIDGCFTRVAHDPKTGIPKISQMRAELGAIQNRLEHTIANVDTIGENIQAAESRIRDADMAKEMLKHTISNILTQSATAMMAQANQMPQTVLSLLR